MQASSEVEGQANVSKSFICYKVSCHLRLLKGRDSARFNHNLTAIQHIKQILNTYNITI